MAQPEVKKKKLIKKLKNRYRLVLMNDTTFDERFAASLTPLNVIAGVSLVFFCITAIVVSLISFTPLREYIPGYSDSKTRLRALRSAVVADSLAEVQSTYISYFENVKRILSGEVELDTNYKDQVSPASVYEDLDFSVSVEDSLLRAEIESRDQYALSSVSTNNAEFLGLPGVLFFAPIRGRITAGFNSGIGHFGIDVTAGEGEAIKSVYDGVVILASFTSDGGNVIQIQHPGNLISIYKHNSVLLKKVGDRVKAGESIAIIGNSGEFSDGPHLHFELWYNGSPLNPIDFIAFSS